jgi:hypothetical protein
MAGARAKQEAEEEVGHSFIKECMTEEEIVAAANVIVAPHGLQAEILGGIKRVGVQGDERTYGPVLVLTGPYPTNEVLAEISSQLTNKLPVTGVTIETARRKESESTAGGSM